MGANTAPPGENTAAGPRTALRTGRGRLLKRRREGGSNGQPCRVTLLCVRQWHGGT